MPRSNRAVEHRTNGERLEALLLSRCEDEAEAAGVWAGLQRVKTHVVRPVRVREDGLAVGRGLAQSTDRKAGWKSYHFDLVELAVNAPDGRSERERRVHLKEVVDAALSMLHILAPDAVRDPLAEEDERDTSSISFSTEIERREFERALLSGYGNVDATKSVRSAIHRIKQSARVPVDIVDIARWPRPVVLKTTTLAELHGAILAIVRKKAAIRRPEAPLSAWSEVASGVLAALEVLAPDMFTSDGQTREPLFARLHLVDARVAPLGCSDEDPDSRISEEIARVLLHTCVTDADVGCIERTLLRLSRENGTEPRFSRGEYDRLGETLAEATSTFAELQRVDLKPELSTDGCVVGVSGEAAFTSRAESSELPEDPQRVSFRLSTRPSRSATIDTGRAKPIWVALRKDANGVLRGSAHFNDWAAEIRETTEVEIVEREESIEFTIRVSRAPLRSGAADEPSGSWHLSRAFDTASVVGAVVARMTSTLR